MQHDLAAGVPLLQLAVRILDFVERVDARDCHRFYADTTKNNSMRGCPDRERVRRHRLRNG